MQPEQVVVAFKDGLEGLDVLAIAQVQAMLGHQGHCPDLSMHQILPTL